jgi:peptidoglycan hydrolase-like protein with peptidoglycan-binding domain
MVTAMRRRTLGLIVLATVVVSSLVTWLATAMIRSPAEAAARTAPPVPSPILVPVEERRLATTVVSRGTGHYGSPREVSVTPSALKAGNQVVTTLPGLGKVLSQGQVLLTISGRPTFLLDGSQPSYRDLGPGVSGQDVRQLERALKRLGLNPGRVDGTFDRYTASAVARLYRSRGFAPLIATETQLDGVRPREAEMIAGARSRSGVQVPADEVIFAPATPVRVTERKVPVGAPPDGALLTVTDSVVAVDGALPVENATLVKAGMKVTIDEPALGITAHGTVRAVAPRPGTNGADGFHVWFSVVVTDPPPALVGASVRLTIPIDSSGSAGLAVPASAISLGPDGTSRVQRSAGGKTDFVTVTPGLSADGYVAVTAPGGDLGGGDLVVAGFEQSGARSG